MMKPLDDSRKWVKRTVPERVALNFFAAVFFFGLGFYFGEATHKAPEAAQQIQQMMKR
jgi:hypothetical protein